MKLNSKKAVLLASAIAGAILTIATVSGAMPSTNPTSNDDAAHAAAAAVRAGKGQVLPGQPEDVTYSMWWKDCRFVFAKSRVIHEQAPNGQEVGVVDPPETLPDQAADVAQDHACVPHQPTDAEIQAAQEQIAALKGSGRPDTPAPPPLRPVRH